MKDLDQILKRAKDQGFEVTFTRKKHYKIRGDKGVVFTSGTPSDWRSVRNTIAQLKRIGYDHNQR